KPGHGASGHISCGLPAAGLGGTMPRPAFVPPRSFPPMSRLSAACLACVVFSSPLLAEDWPSWRGPRGDGTSLEKGVPAGFSPERNVRWRVEVPGSGYSSPVVHGERVFLTTCLEGKGERVLLCLDRGTGKTLWSRTVLTAPLERKHRENSYASA